MSRIRITFTKQGALRYTGHLDLHKLWERAARRAELPLTYSQGYHPQPKISLAAALPLGFSSRDEVLDLKLNQEMPLEEIGSRLKDNLPSGIQVLKMEIVDECAPALQTQVVSAEYKVTLTETIDGSALKRKVEMITSADSLPRERRGKHYDMRPLIEEIRVVSNKKELASLFMRLTARAGATGRPEEVLDEIGIPAETVHVERTRLIFQE